MGVIAQYQVTTANPYKVGGTNGTLQYFASNPPQSLWNSGVTGVNAPITNTELGQVPSSTSALGQLDMPQFASLTGNRFRIVATGAALATASTPTITPIIQINTSTNLASASYSTIGGNVASNATVNNKWVSWSIEAKLVYDSSALAIGGFMNYQFVNQSGGGTDKSAIDAAITTVSGLTAVGVQGGPAFGFVVGITFSAGTTGNSAYLYEFKIIQD